MIDIENLAFSYKASKEEVFSSFSLRFDRGKKILLIAEPGSGKSTLSRILTGAISTGISGRFLIGSEDIFSLSAEDRMDRVGRVSQDTDEMLLFPSVYDEISFPLENLGLDEDEIEERAERALSMFSMEAFKEVSSSELSGGEKRRLLLAILFAIDPELYILDESFDELSPKWREKLRGIIKDSTRSFIVMASHYLDEYEGLFDEVYSINDGKLSKFEDKKYEKLVLRDIVDEALTVKKIKLERHHRSSSLLPSFTLDVDNLSISRGECVVILGDNGSGKSTLSKVLCGLLKEESGKVLLNGRTLSPKERKVNVAYLMQNPFSQLFLATVEDELRSTGADDNRIQEALDLFGLDGSWYISEISYGRAKLVQAALFHLLKRPFAIFDEIDSAIGYEDSLKCVESYLREGTGLIVITHDRKFASLLPGEKYEMKDGRLCR